MKKRKNGNSEMFVNPVGLGCMGFSHAGGDPIDYKTVVKILRQSYEMGYDFFDTAEAVMMKYGLYARGRRSWTGWL